MDWVSEVKRRQAAKGGYLPAGMKPSGTMSTYQPTLRERGTDYLRKLLFSDDRAGQQRAERLSDVAETVTPYGLATGMYDAGKAGGQGDYATAGLMTAMAGLPGPSPKGFKAYHGSPHDFDRFSLDKIGTGEGAQAYGHGLYFADSEGVAKSYRDALSPSTIDGVPAKQLGTTKTQSDDDLLQSVLAMEKTPANARWRLDRLNRLDLMERLDEMVASGRVKPGGHMYEVQINADPDSFLDWDKPLSEQPESIRNALKDAWLAHPDVDANKTGASIYSTASNPLKAEGSDGAARALREAGIPGVKYLDAGSRTKGDGSRNYVVFDDKLIEILKKYGLFGPVVGASAMAAQDDSAPY